MELLRLVIRMEDLDKLNINIKEIASQKLKQLYGEKINQSIMDRFNVELNNILKNKFENYYKIAYMIANKANEDNEIIISRGTASASFINYLLGINYINPIEYNIPLEIWAGINGDKTPDYEFAFGTEYINTIYKYIKTKLEENKIFYQDKIDSMDSNMAKINFIPCKELDELIEFEENTKINHTSINAKSEQLIKEYMEQEDDGKLKNILLKTNPQSVEQLIKCYSLYRGTGVWDNNIENLIEKYSINEMLCSREDIYLYLQRCGIDKKIAFDIMELVGKGRTKHSKYIKDWENSIKIMKEHNVPEDYIKSFSKIKYMFPKAHVANYILLNLWLTWYYINENIEIPTGFYGLDYIIKGLKEGSLNIIASRPGMGKTTLAFNIATFVAYQDIPVAIFNLELSKEKLLRNITASTALVDINKLNTGKLNEDDLNKVKESKKSLEKKEIYIDDTPKMSIAEIREKSRKLKLEKNIGLIVIDYLQLIDTTSNDEQGRTEIMTNLKRLAKELNIPILVVSQLKSKVEQREDKKLYLTDLSKCIVQYADVIMFMNMDEEDDHIRKITIAKNKYGRIDKIELLFISKWLKFVNLEKWGDKFDKYWI